MTDYAPYLAYLIRIWPAPREDETGCRVTVQNVATGESQMFASWDALLAFLQAADGFAQDPGSALRRAP